MSLHTLYTHLLLACICINRSIGIQASKTTSTLPKDPKSVVPISESTPPWPQITRNMRWLNRAWCPTKYSKKKDECHYVPLTQETMAEVDIVNVDLFEVTDDEIRIIKAHGKLVACYFSAGTAEEWRYDLKVNQAAWQKIYGNRMRGWSDEIWLDIRKQETLLPLMAFRLTHAKHRGCDIIEPDNVDCWQATPRYRKIGNKRILKRKGCIKNQSIYKEDNPATHDMYMFQLGYNMWLAQYTHSLGMAIGLKNDLPQASALEPFFDFLVVEEIEFDNYYRKEMSPFINARKAIFIHQYNVTPTSVENKKRIAKYRAMLLEQDCARQASEVKSATRVGTIASMHECNITLKDIKIDKTLYWEQDYGAAFCKMCRQTSSIGANLLVPAKWDASTWANCNSCSSPDSGRDFPNVSP